MARRELIDALILTSIGAFVLAIVVPGFFAVRTEPPIPIVKGSLKSIYKECTILQAREVDGLNLNLLYLQAMQPPVPHYLDWRIVDFNSGDALDPDQDCFEAHLLAIPTSRQKFYKQLAYGLNIQNAKKSCFTREGVKREDWSCE